MNPFKNKSFARLSITFALTAVPFLAQAEIQGNGPGNSALKPTGSGVITQTTSATLSNNPKLAGQNYSIGWDGNVTISHPTLAYNGGAYEFTFGPLPNDKAGLILDNVCKTAFGLGSHVSVELGINIHNLISEPVQSDEFYIDGTKTTSTVVVLEINSQNQIVTKGLQNASGTTTTVYYDPTVSNSTVSGTPDQSTISNLTCKPN